MSSDSSGGRYVPPHLRGRGNNNNNNNNINNNNKLNSTSGGSRWNNVREGSATNSGRNGYHPTARCGGRNNHTNNGGGGSSDKRSVKGSGASRWANVDRTAIATGNPSSSRGDRTNHGRPASQYHHRRRFDRTADAGENRHRHHHHPPRHDLSHARAVFFGDSFIKLFGLLNEYSDAMVPPTPRPIEVQKYKAASAKGLSREGNDNRTAILRTVEAIRRRKDDSGSFRKPYQSVERLVFCFGSVDVHLSYYYKKYVQEQPLSDDDLEAIATSYVDFVAGLDTTTNSNDRSLDKLIVGIYPSPLRDEDVGASLLAYGSLETEDQVVAVDATEDRTIESRQARVDRFNRALRDRCEHHNRDGSSFGGVLEYWDVRDELLTRYGDNDGRVRVRDAYKDVSDLNIHLIHETTLQLWVQKWPWYEALTTTAAGRNKNANSNANDTTSAGFLEYLQKTFDEYRKTKPWAERTHVAETRGIKLSL